MTAFCPKCGFDLEQDKPVEFGLLKIDPRGQVFWDGYFLHLSPSHNIIVTTLVKAEGRPVKGSILAERMGYEGDDPTDLIGVQMHKLRKRHPMLPIENVRPFGYRWAA